MAQLGEVIPSRNGDSVFTGRQPLNSLVPQKSLSSTKMAILKFFKSVDLRDFTVKGVLGDVSARKLANNIIESNGTLQNKEISVDIRSQI